LGAPTVVAVSPVMAEGSPSCLARSLGSGCRGSSRLFFSLSLFERSGNDLLLKIKVSQFFSDVLFLWIITCSNKGLSRNPLVRHSFPIFLPVRICASRNAFWPISRKVFFDGSPVGIVMMAYLTTLPWPAAFLLLDPRCSQDSGISPTRSPLAVGHDPRSRCCCDIRLFPS